MEIRYYKKALYKPGDMVHQGDFGGRETWLIRSMQPVGPLHGVFSDSGHLRRSGNSGPFPGQRVRREVSVVRPSWCQRTGAAGRRAPDFPVSPRTTPTAAGPCPRLVSFAVARGSQDGDQERSEVVRELNSRLCLPSHVVCWQQDSEFLFSFLLRQ